LPVKGRAPKTGYTREQFGPAWTDDNNDALGHNGCDTRNDILRRDLVQQTLKPGTNGCVVLTGVLHDPYTGTAIHFVRGPAPRPQYKSITSSRCPTPGKPGRSSGPRRSGSTSPTTR
jgi:hypothetical protein